MSVRTTGRVHCPIEPDVLLADIQGELTIEEARDIKAHIRTCDRCQARFAQLRDAYEQVASLSDVPAMPPADVRDTVLRDSQGRLRAVRITRGLNLSGRGMLLTLAGLLGVILIFFVAIVRPFLEGRVLSSSRSQNSLSNVASVGAGFFYAETVKLIPVSINGSTWDLGEIVVVDERTAHVVRSIPSSSQSPFIPELGIGSGTNIKPALTSDGQTVIEAAIPTDGHSPTAFAAIDAVSGKVRYLTQLALPDGAPAQSVPVIQQLWITSDNKTVFVLTDLAINGQRSPHLLQFDLATGKQNSVVVPPLDAANNGAVLGGITTAMSPDGSAFYDATPGTDAQGHPGANITFVDIANRKVAATVFVPGDFSLMGLAVSPNGSQLFLFNGHSTAVYFISTASRSVIQTVTLGKLSTPAAMKKSGESVSLMVSPDSKRLFIALDLPTITPRTFNLWTVDIDQQSFLAVTQLPNPIGPIALTSDAGTLIMLRSNGVLQALSTTEAKTPAPWVTLAGNAAVTQIIGAYLPPPPPAATATPGS